MLTYDVQSIPKEVSKQKEVQFYIVCFCDLVVILGL